MKVLKYPYRCPNCGTRFKKQEGLHKHFVKDKACYELALDIKVSIQTLNFEALDELKRMTRIEKAKYVVGRL